VSISIPSSVTTIKYGAFNDCKKLSSIYSYSSSPIELSSFIGAFINVNKVTCTLFVPAGSKITYQNSFGWNEFENIIEGQIPELKEE
jgi:hypothetical protein